MAVVRITDTLSNEVLMNADKLFADKIKAAQELALPYSPQELYDLMFGEWKEHMLALPHEIIPRDSKLSINRVAGISVNLEVVLPVPMPIPNRVPDTDHLAAVGYYGKTFDLLGGKWGLLFERAKEREARVNSVLAEKTQFKNGVQSVLKRFSTLAPALKAWPPLWDLLPEHAQNKHKQIVERKKAELDLDDVNLDKLTSTVILSKLTR